MNLEIGVGFKRGNLATGNYYSDGKNIRKVVHLAIGEVTYKKVVNGIETGEDKVVKTTTMDNWAKWPVIIR